MMSDGALAEAPSGTDAIFGGSGGADTAGGMTGGTIAGSIAPTVAAAAVALLPAGEGLAAAIVGGASVSLR